jgi:cytochrome c peroxidase
MRQTTGRNAPSSVNAVFNLYQFWDGRADTKSNGFNPIGRHDTSTPKYLVNSSGRLQAKVLNMQVASLASQATGPPLSDVEMSFAGRTWPEIGKKLLRAPDGGSPLTPLAYQEISTTDSVLGPYVNASGYGLNTTYVNLVKAAFKDNLWNNTTQVTSFPSSKLARTTTEELIQIPGLAKIITVGTRGKPSLGQYTQMEANFSLFWGIAVMLYEAELVSEQSRFDKWMEGTGTLTTEELDGLNVYVNEGKCIACHSGPELTNATVRNTQNGKAQIEPVRKTNGDPAFYDNGFYNVGMTPTVDDIQRGDKDPFGRPWGNSRQFLFQENGIMNIPFTILGLPIRGLEARNPVDTTGDGIPDQQELWKVLHDILTGEISDEFLVCYDLNMNGVCDLSDDVVIQTLDIDGNCKSPTVRNVELNAPYFHNGGAATLQQVLDTYDIGGKFRKTHLNKVDMLPDITRLGLGDKTGPNGTNAEEALIAFMLALTDERVRTEAKPFDHPQLFLPIDGTAPMLDPSDPYLFFETQILAGTMTELPATGAAGGTPLGWFLGLDPFAGDTGKGSIVEVDDD